MPQLRTLRILLILTACLLAGMIVAFLLKPTTAQDSALSSRLGGDFTLQSLAGPVSLTDFRGKAVVIYIGYASCPDVCPTALAILSQALKNLPPEQQARVQGIFISVDPERDTLEHLDRYSRFFSDRIIGVTGTREQIDSVVKQYGAFYRKVELEGSAMGYAIDHSSRLYLVAPDGAFAGTLLHNSTPDELTRQLQKML